MCYNICILAIQDFSEGIQLVRHTGYLLLCDLLPDCVCLSVGWTQRTDSNVFPLSRICTLTTLLRSLQAFTVLQLYSKLLGVYYIYTMNTEAGCVSIFARLRVIVTKH